MGVSEEIASKFSYIFEQQNIRITQNEHLILNAFSYVCSQIDDLRLEIYKLQEEKLAEKNGKKVEDQSNNIIEEKEKICRKKRQRSLWYYITKKSKYKKLIQKKHKLEIEIEERNKIRKEEEAKLKAKLKKEKEEEQKKQIQNIRKQITNILKTTKGGK